MQPLVSVVIPTYNRAQLLKEAIESVLVQTYENWELFVVDDLSTDNTVQLVDEYVRLDKRIHLLVGKGHSPAGARNIGIQESRGEYIAFLDDDDWWLPSKLKEQLKVFQDSEKDMGLVTCGAYRYTRSGERIIEWPSFGKRPILEVLVTDGCIIRSLSGVMLKRQCFTLFGLFDETNLNGEDFELYLRLAPVSGFKVIEEPLYCYRQHDGNVTNRITNVLRVTIRLTKSVLPNSSQGVTHAIIRRRLAQLYYSLGVEEADQRNYGDASQAYLNAVCFDFAVGNQIKWSRSHNIVYKFARPYFAVIYYAAVQLWQAISGRNKNS